MGKVSYHWSWLYLLTPDPFVYTLSLHKQHIRLFVKRLGERLSVDWRNLYKIEPLVESN